MSHRHLPTCFPARCPSGLALIGALVALPLLATACGGKGAPYTIETPRVTLSVKDQGQATIRFVPGSGFKWNNEFPARLKILEAGSVAPAKSLFTQADKDFQDRNGTGVVELAVTSSTPGATTMRTTADFSVCNDDECRIFRAIPIEIPILVQ